MSTRSIYPTGGARTPRLRMDTDDAIRLYRFERESSRARRYDSLEAERAALEAAMARTWNGSKQQKPRALLPCLCGCGLICAPQRQTASAECLRRVRTEQIQQRKGRNRRCQHCLHPLVRPTPNQEYCRDAACQLARFRRKNAARRARSSLTPNRKAS